nr:hypothetical protein [Tanacetum cinerariifolium]
MVVQCYLPGQESSISIKSKSFVMQPEEFKIRSDWDPQVVSEPELIPESFVNSSELLEKQDNISDKGYHEVPPPLIGNYMPPKHDLRLIDEHFESEYVDVSTISSSDVKTVDHKGVFSTEEPKHVNTAKGKVVANAVKGNQKADSEPCPKKKHVQAPKGKRLKATVKVPKSRKKKLPTQGLETLSEIALSEAEQMKISTKRSRTQFHVSYASGSDNDDADNQGDDDEDNDGQDDENEQTESDNDGDDFVHPKLSTFNEEEIPDESWIKKKKKGDNVEEGMDTKMTDALLTNVQATQVIEETHVIMTVVTLEAQQQSSSISSGFISNMLNPNLDIGIDSILNLNTESTSLVDVHVTTNVEIPPSSVITFHLPLIPLIQPQQQTPVPTPAIVPTEVLSRLSNEAKTSHAVATNLSELELKKILIDKMKSNKSIHQSNQQKTLYKALINAYETNKTNQFAEAVSSIPGIVDTFLANKMNEAVKTAVQLTVYSL